MKEDLTKIGTPDANRYSLKGFRRWRTTEIRRSGSILATILGIGGGGGRVLNIIYIYAMAKRLVLMTSCLLSIRGLIPRMRKVCPKQAISICAPVLVLGPVTIVNELLPWPPRKRILGPAPAYFS